MLVEKSIPWNSHLIIPIVEFDKKKVIKIKKYFPLFLLVTSLTIYPHNYGDSVYSYFKLGIVIILGSIGIWAAFGIRAHKKIGLLELCPDYLTISLGGIETRYNWEEITHVSLAYMTDKEGYSPLLPLQIERCFIYFQSKDNFHFHYFILEFDESSKSIYNLIPKLKIKYPQHEFINSYGDINISKIDAIKRLVGV